MNKDNINIVDVDFDIESISDAPMGATTGSHKASDNAAAMDKFWAVTPILWLVGLFLANRISKAQDAPRLADVLAAGKVVKGVKSVKVAGITVPVVPFDLSIATCRNGWGCPACLSAHGTSVGSSGSANTGPNADNLAADNVFYYRPSDKRLFTISKTCAKKYVYGPKDAPLAVGKRVYTPTAAEVQAFLNPPAPETPAPETPAPETPVSGRNRRSA